MAGLTQESIVVPVLPWGVFQLVRLDSFPQDIKYFTECFSVWRESRRLHLKSKPPEVNNNIHLIMKKKIQFEKKKTIWRIWKQPLSLAWGQIERASMILFHWMFFLSDERAVVFTWKPNLFKTNSYINFHTKNFIHWWNSIRFENLPPRIPQSHSWDDFFEPFLSQWNIPLKIPMVNHFLPSWPWPTDLN